MDEWEDEEYEEEEYEEELSVSQLIEQEKIETLRLMRSIDRSSDEGREQYLELANHLNKLTESTKNEAVAINEASQAEESENAVRTAEKNKNTWLWAALIPAGCQLVGSALSTVFNRKNVKTVVKTEDDGGIVNSKGTIFLNKSRS